MVSIFTHTRLLLIERLSYPFILLPILTDYLDSGHWPTAAREWITEVSIGLLIAAFILLVRRSRKEIESLDLRRVQLSQFIVHDIKNPLSCALAAVSCVVQEESPFDKQMSFLNIAINSCRKGLSLADKILEVEKAESAPVVRREPVDMKALLSDCANEISGAAVLSEVTIAVESDPAPVSVDADGELLRRAVMNLLQNALKYTPAEGKITLRSERRDGRVLVRVTDSGRGISRENQEGLFNKFYRVEKDSARVQGTGLGLYFCRLVAEAHGGAVGLESAPGKGTTVTIDLPASASGLTGGEAK